MKFMSRSATPPTPLRRTRRSLAGFTLAEVMMAAGVMAFAISGSIVVIQSGVKAVDNARNTTLASQIIQSEMERIRLLNWSDVNSLGASANLVLTTIFPPGTTTTTMNARFTATRTCTDTAGKVGEMKDITITVSWVGVDGKTHRRTTTGNYCKNGLYDYYYTLAGT
jgi:type II secretory pathway pseudopilin PulG